MAEVNIRKNINDAANILDVRALSSRVETTNPEEQVTTMQEVKTTTGTIAVTDDTNTIVTIAQPAGTILTNLPLYIIENSHGKAANQFATTGIGPKGGPATTEAVVIAAALYSAAARSIYVTLRPIGADLATAATTVTYIAQFQEL